MLARSAAPRGGLQFVEGAREWVRMASLREGFQTWREMHHQGEAEEERGRSQRSPPRSNWRQRRWAESNIFLRKEERMKLTTTPRSPSTRRRGGIGRQVSSTPKVDDDASKHFNTSTRRDWASGQLHANNVLHCALAAAVHGAMEPGRLERQTCHPQNGHRGLARRAERPTESPRLIVDNNASL